MTYGKPWQSYRQVATNTAPPGQLVLMLYDGAIRFLNKAIAGFQLEDPLEYNETISNNIIRAQDIINELNLSLNMDAGGQFSQTMRALYLYLDRRLQESNIRKDESGLSEVVRRVTVLRDAWAEMLSKSADASAGAPATAPVMSLEAQG